jgi:hypothetical protein
MTTRLLNTQRIVNIASDPISGSSGEIYYNTTENALRYYNGSSWVNFNVDYTSVVKHLVKNDSGTTLSKGTVVYTSGANGTNILVKPAYSASDLYSSQTLGFLETQLAPNGIGYAINNGLITGINTSAANAGDPVWLSASAGLVIYGFDNEPKAPQHLVYLGVVTRSNTNNGEIFVHVSNGWEIGELHNVRITSASANHILNYNAASAIWINENLATVIGRVDGSGSDIDADLLDGQHGSYYAPINSPTLTGIPAAPTAAADTNTTQIATTAYVIGQGYLKSSSASSTYATIDSPTFTGTLTAPTVLLTTADTATAASHYFVETASDGIIRPKTLANVRTEIVTQAAVNSASATVLGTVTTGTWSATAIAAASGGTGQTSYAIGDILYASASNALTRLAGIATGNALISGGVTTAPSWGKIGLTTHVSGTLPIANGGTNATATPTQGGIAYGTGSAYAFTAAGTAGQVLTSNGTSAPTWQEGGSGFEPFFLAGL